jgi:hypothetical protein
MKKVKELRTKIISNNINNNFNKNLNSFDEIILSKKQRKKNYNKNDFDELDTLIKFINDNINDFTIEFNLNNNNNYELNNIKNQYNQILKVNEYKNKIINNYDNFNNNQNSININNIENLIDSNSDENEINTSEIFNKKYLENNLNNIKIKNKNNEKENISLNLINEFLSLFSKEINFENIKSNFYYTNKNTISNLKSNLFYFSDTEGLKNEITTFEQLNNSINYYKTFINNFWKKKYFEEKQE